jgi:K+-sensing histidine kinase KdpD/CheY-like chemotaxis protein
VFVEVLVHPIAHSSGAATRLVTMRDVTRQRALEANLQRARQLEAFGLLAGGVAHDFNNALTAITGFVELLLAETGPHAIQGTPRTWVGEIRRAADRCSELTRKLLSVGRGKAASTRRARPVALDDVVRRCAPLLERVLREDVRLEVSLGASSLQIDADPEQLELVLLNLAANARDAMPGGGRLSVATAPGEASTEAIVRITASGMGTGLGLAIVNAIVDELGGRTAVASEADATTTFRIHLPLSAAARSPTSRGQTVLVVEDEAPVRGVLEAMLGRLGFQTLACADADAAMQQLGLHHERVACVLTDVQLPGEDGLALERRIRTAFPGVAVILTSGLRRDAPEPTGAFWLDKPVTLQALDAVLRKVLGG